MDFTSVIPIITSDKMRKRLENLAHSIGNNYNSRLIFSENTCTNGSIMQINPRICEEYNSNAITKTCEKFNFEKDPFLVAMWDIKASTVHESGHDAFSDFNIFENINDDLFMETNYGKTIVKNILNIIEDAYIENAMCALYKGTRKYILFSNEMAFEARTSLNKLEKAGTSQMDLFLEYFIQKIILRKVKGEISDETVLAVIKKCEPLFHSGAWSLQAQVRYEFAKKIYSILKTTLYNPNEQINLNSYSSSPNGDSNNSEQKSNDKNSSESSDNQKTQNNFPQKEKFKKKRNLHNGDSKSQQLKDNPNFSNASSVEDTDKNVDFEQNERMSDKDEVEAKNEMEISFASNKSEEEILKKELEQNKEAEKKDLEMKEELKNIEYSELNKYINVLSSFPMAADAITHSQEYYDFYNQVSGNISVFVQQFKKLLEKQEEYETGLEMGDALDSSKFGRKDRKFWKEEISKKNPAKLSITILVDGSGSTGFIMPEIIKTCIVIYEVAKKLKMPISIIEERAIYGTNNVEHNVKVGYNSPDAFKYNIASLKSDSGTREGVSLLWTYNYMKKSCSNTKNLFIVLSDGEPEHTGYSRPYNIKDSNEAAKKIERDKSCQLVAICLNERAYMPLKDIYRHVINCSDNISNLSMQIVKLMKKSLQ